MTPEEIDTILSGGTESEGRSIIGRIIYDTMGQLIGRVVAPARTGGGRLGNRPLVADIYTGAILGPLPAQGGTFIGEGFRELVIDGRGNIQTEQGLSQPEIEAIQMGLDYRAGSAGRTALVGGGAGGGGGRTFGEDISFLERQAALEEAAAERERLFEAEQAQKNRDLQIRLQRLDDAMRLSTTLAGLQENARNLVAETMGRDPFRGAVRAQGGIGAGFTPMQQFRSQLRGVASAPIPTISGEAGLPEIEGTIAAQNRLIEQVPTAPIGIRGLAQGGKIGEKDMPVGAGVLVGETAPEVLRFGKNGEIEVIPLIGGAQGGLRAAAGASTDLGAFQGLRPLFEHVGIRGEAPIGVRTAPAYGSMFQTPFVGRGIGFPTSAGSRTSEIFRQLGTTPRLMYVPEFDTFFSMDPSGETQIVGNAQRLIELGGDPTEAFIVPRDEAKELGSFGNQAQPYQAESLAFEPLAGQFGQQSPIFSPFDMGESRGLYLPDPALLASLWPTLDPDTQRLAISAYGLGGVSEEQLLRRMNFFTPRGTGSAARTATLG
ncbi:MAG: hypothetical protein A2W00_13315 [Candidatus Eisenbacteria bacterium RBG_16_71_46]|nr:MAG: hypothetical protein A2W00_13315 [Candidatus Eisenbacteria bacterium RBG_16_71_46]HAM40565.1 hypothetical protein [Candidatus Omnitrophota bacterium]